ncbi:MAG TPA: DUF2924 domain-containing protein [Candidatus Limnocylindria bacterium]|nr:DUF2924 domain-containing protein [Candidatus Limnocylindria bacterium]
MAQPARPAGTAPSAQTPAVAAPGLPAAGGSAWRPRSATRRYLDRIARADASGTAVPLPVPNARAVRPGTVLVREWAGGTCHVMALDDGFAWNGTTYRSLSQVARTITGTRWNGRRFFGVVAANGPTSSGMQP